MIIKFSIPLLLSMILSFSSCICQEEEKEQKQEPHRYGGWYCPDNFGFVPVDIEKLNEVPAISDRLSTEQELNDNMSLIRVDMEKHPDAKALEMDLPRVASVYSDRRGINELIIVIQAIVVQKDTVVGFRYANGGNGSTWISDVTFLSDEEVAEKGSLPYFYSTSVLKSSTEEIWGAVIKTDYFKQLGEKFDHKKFFSSKYNPEAQAYLELEVDGEKATGYVGMVYGNYYLQIDYNRNGFHYSEKLLMIENQDDKTTKLFFASGPYPEDFEKQKTNWDGWVNAVTETSEAD